MPSEGACGWGINKARAPWNPTCDTCMDYYDGRVDGKNPNLQGNDCVWVPAHGMCRAENYAIDENLTYHNYCDGLNFSLV